MREKAASTASTAGTAAPAPVFDDVGHWFEALLQPRTALELLVLAVCVGVSWLVVWGLRRTLRPSGDAPSIFLGRNVIDGVLFPLLLLGLVALARSVLGSWTPLAALHVAIPVLMALAAVRVGSKVLRAAFPQARWLRWFEQSLSWVAWGSMVLWITGLLPVLWRDLDEIQWKVGSSSLSVATLIEGLITVGAVMIAALWVSSAIEARLLRQASGDSLSVRKALSNVVRALLLFVGVLVAASAVGIDLSTLSVLGGAVGVGIGLGLQRLAASYVSGFVILAERSVRIGDSVRVDGFEGRITDITGRYTVVRSGAGRESIVPNDVFISSRIENLCLSDQRVWNSTVVSVGYDSDPELVLSLLREAALASPRVLRDPAPGAWLTNFGPDGLEFTVGFWIGDPENGLLGVRSDIHLAILRSLRAHQIDIPYPQRVLHWPADAAQPRPSSPPPSQGMPSL